MVQRSSIKYAFAGFAYNSGLTPLFLKWRYQGQAIVLMYHRVVARSLAENDAIQPGMYVSSETFSMHLDILQGIYKPICLAELVKRVKEGKSVDGYYCITFDDGWLDNYTNAFPILESRGVPATIFLATGFIGAEKIFWTSKLSKSLKIILQQNEVCKLQLPLREYVLRLQENNYSHVEVIDMVTVFLKTRPPNERHDLLSNVVSLVHSDETQAEREMMNWEEVHKMKASGLIDFGAHTVNHVLLDQVVEIEARREVAESLDKVKQELDCQDILFAYPNGNMGDNSVEVVKEAGAFGAVTVKRGGVSSQTHSMELPRIGLHEDISSSPALFFWRLAIK